MITFTEPTGTDVKTMTVTEGATIAELGPDGQFEFKGLAKGVCQVFLGVKGYHLPDRIEALVDHDVKDLTVTMAAGDHR